MNLLHRTAGLQALLDTMPDAPGERMTASLGSRPLVEIYKIIGETFVSFHQTRIDLERFCALDDHTSHLGMPRIE